MQNKVAILLLTGFTVLGIAVSAVAAAEPPPADPPTFFSTVVPFNTPASEAVAAAAAPTEAPAADAAADIARPSNPGGPGVAASMNGDASAGQVIFEANCVRCHAEQGKGGVVNPGSDDGTVPPLNPIDETLVSTDYRTFATNLDLFLEHGSTPSGPSPVFSMPDWGDSGKLTPQQIADVIAYVISLNK